METNKWTYYKGSSDSDLIPIQTVKQFVTILEKCHEIIWQGGKLNPSDAFDELSKILACKIYDERITKSGDPYIIQIKPDERRDILNAEIIPEMKQKVCERIYELYSEYKFTDECIRLGDTIVYQVIEQLQSFTISKTNIDIKNVASELFMKDFFKGKMGQYSTPRELVKFMVEMLHIQTNEKLLDPVCGTGGFILTIINNIRNNINLEYATDQERYTHLTEFVKNNLFGIEINEQIARTCNLHMIINESSIENIIISDSLNSIENINSKIRAESFDVVLMNPPIRKVYKSEKDYYDNYELGKHVTTERIYQSTEILFIEQGLNFLKNNGRMAIIMPDNILTNTKLQYVRDFIINKARIDAIIGLPKFAIYNHDDQIKCSILFLTKGTFTDNYDIFMADVENIGYNNKTKSIKLNDFPEVIDKYKTFCINTNRQKDLHNNGVLKWQ